MTERERRRFDAHQERGRKIREFRTPYAERVTNAILSLIKQTGVRPSSLARIVGTSPQFFKLCEHCPHIPDVQTCQVLAAIADFHALHNLGDDLVSPISLALNVTPQRARSIDFSSFYQGYPVRSALSKYRLVINSHVPGFLYAIRRSVDGAVKIGFSWNPMERIRQLIGFKTKHLSLLGIIFVSNMAGAEHSAHYVMHRHIIGHEWFSLTNDQVCWFLSSFSLIYSGKKLVGAPRHLLPTSADQVKSVVDLQPVLCPQAA